MYTFRSGWWVNVKAYCQTLVQKLWLDRHGILYKLHKPKVPIDFALLQTQLLKRLKQYTGFGEQGQNYIVELTPFGVYGLYHLPNRITVNAQRLPEDIANTILHEVVHLRLEAEVSRKRLTHRQKEDLVEKEFARLMAQTQPRQIYKRIDSPIF